MTSWEYTQIQVPTGRDALPQNQSTISFNGKKGLFSTILNELGLECWELFAVQQGVGFLKRPIDDSEIETYEEVVEEPAPPPAVETPEEDYDDNPFDPGQIDEDDFLDDESCIEDEADQIANQLAAASHGQREKREVIQLPPPGPGHDPEVTGII